MIIYSIKNLVNDKIYVGQTKRNLETRVSEHARKNFKLGKDIRKYGKSNFEITELAKASNQEELDRLEKHWIIELNCIHPNGYNLCDGGFLDTTGYKHTEKTKKIMREQKKNLFSGKDNPFYGKTHSELQKKKWSKERKGMSHLTDEQVKKLRDSHIRKTVRCVETGEIFNSIKEAGEKCNIKATHITRVCKGRRKTTGGYHWEYI